MDILDLLTHPGDDSFYDTGFHVVLESHLTYFKENGYTVVRSIEPIYSYIYEGDFFGLLDYLRIPKCYHYFILRLNGYNSPGDLKKDTREITLPDYSVIDILQRQYQTRKTLV